MSDGGSRRGFTLVELLVVIGIIALLISILLPTLSRAQQSARSVACKSLLRQYALASEMYMNDNDGWTVDSYNHLDAEKGLVRYMGDAVLPEDVARCPGDATTEQMGRLGRFTPTGADGREYEVLASIGCNENSTSASARPTSVGPRPIWVRRSFFVGNETTKIMSWADWQNNPQVDEPGEAVVKPANVGMGSLVFRHLDASNAAFMDGHVGQLRPLIGVVADGHELDDGSGNPGGNWPVPEGAEGSVARVYKTYAPFGPGRTRAGYYELLGDWPTIAVE